LIMLGSNSADLSSSLTIRDRNPSDLTLKSLVTEHFSGDPRYSDVINSYYYELSDILNSTIEKRYESVLSAISNLWINSEKNPSLFKDAKDFEPILRRGSLPYRDHFMHSFNVFLLGYYIINKIYSVKPNLNYFGRDIIIENADPDFLRRNQRDANLTWMLASTFHDVAYPIQDTESWLNNLFQNFLGADPKFSLNIKEIIPPIYADFMYLLSRYQKHGKQNALGFTDQILEIDWLCHNELGSGLMEKNHGVLGALMLCHRMAIREKFLQKSEPLDFLFNHLPACHAISLHALDSISVTFDKHPFAYLLILCDELQDWCRPSNNDNKDVIELKKIEIDFQNNLKIKIEIESSNSRREKIENILSKRLEKSNLIDLKFLPKQTPSQKFN
jgi:hypothetical protein